MVQLGNHPVGEGHPSFVTFEAGPTHDGLASAQALASHAADAGAHAVKFQILDPDRLVADRQQPISYEILADRDTGRRETVTEPLYDVLCRRTLTRAQWHELKAFCDSRNLAFFATVSFPDEVALIEEMGCHSIKIASGDVNHFPLLRRAARSGLCLQLDTGNATLGEIESAVDVIRAEGNENFLIHQCPSGYPARLESINLNIIPTLKAMFGMPVAFSDHTPGREMDVAAIARGANLVEKTITLDRTTRSIEHIMSLEPGEMAEFVQAMRDLETALGTRRRHMAAEERSKRLGVRRSTYLPEGGRAGQRLGDLPVDFRRPGYGLAPDQYEALLDQVLQRDLPAGHRLTLADLSSKAEQA